jgi:transcription initiation factor TFIIIB Brf1 subunit/transcription initiation factor TFIIB
VLAETVEIFAALKQKIAETRNKKRRQYIAACLYIASITHNLMMTESEVRVFCGLADRSITSTIHELLIAENEGIISTGVNDVDLRVSFAKSICTKCDIDAEHVDTICKDVCYIHDVASENIMSGAFNVKVIGAIYISIRLHHIKTITVKDICNVCSIKPQQVDTFINNCRLNKKLFSHLKPQPIG